MWSSSLRSARRSNGQNRGRVLSLYGIRDATGSLEHELCHLVRLLSKFANECSCVAKAHVPIPSGPRKWSNKGPVEWTWRREACSDSRFLCFSLFPTFLYIFAFLHDLAAGQQPMRNGVSLPNASFTCRIFKIRHFFANGHEIRNVNCHLLFWVYKAENRWYTSVVVECCEATR